jgi:hypothetical protein
VQTSPRPSPARRGLRRDPFQILHWRGRDRETLLANLRERRDSDSTAKPKSFAAPARQWNRVPRPSARRWRWVTCSPLADTVDRFWVAPVPLGAQPPMLDTEVDLPCASWPRPPRRPAPPGIRLREYCQA